MLLYNWFGAFHLIKGYSSMHCTAKTKELKCCKDCNDLFKNSFYVNPTCVVHGEGEVHWSSVLHIWRVIASYCISRSVMEEQKGKSHQQSNGSNICRLCFVLPKWNGDSISPLPVSVLHICMTESVDAGWRKCLIGPAPSHTHMLTSAETAWDSLY